MGVELAVGKKVDSTAMWVCIVTLMALVIIVLGYKLALATDLPHCVADEYLYPKHYEGPGKNVASDYECVHVDVIKEN